MANLTEWVLLAFGAGVLVGQIIGKWGEARIWRLKADGEARTAQCSAGKFYYVIPEREYVERHL